eukprot:7152316-Alexandrium_andersonii.AAC.1
MSASLVGSEMCIRDSHSNREPSTFSWMHLLSHATMSIPAWLRPPGPLAPVSYTHLTLPTICSV